MNLSSPQFVSKLASAGLALVLLALTGVTLWAIIATQASADSATRAVGLDTALDHAQLGMARTEAALTLWSRTGDRRQLVRFQALSPAVLTALSHAGSQSSPVRRSATSSIQARYHHLLVGVSTARRRPGARARARLAPPLIASASSIQAEVNSRASSASHRAEVDLRSLHHLQNTVKTVIVIAFLFGIVLLGFCWWVLDMLRRRVQAEEKALEHQALHDSLTGLPNRTLLADRVRQAVIRARRESVSVSLLLMDLDRFKEVNDTFGHQTGDQLLQQVGFLVRSILRQSDTVARFGGDEFAIVLPNTMEVGAITAAQKLVEGLSQPLFVDGQSFHVGASIGIALFPQHGADHNTLLRRADVAMYTAKRDHTSYAIYSEDQDQDSYVRLALSRDLRYAVDRNELMLQYQPKVDVRSQQVHSVEALIRWKHPQRGLLFPDRFMALAEQTGLVKSLSFWVLGEAMRQCSVWHAAGQELGIAINLSASSLPDTRLADMISYYLEEFAVPASMLEIEVTESVLMADPARAKSVLDRLHELGVRIAIDDFGTGYSSLAYLRRLPVDEIKIDKSFVLDMVTNTEDALIVRSIIDLGHNLGLSVVAEGVEDSATWNLLETMGCDVIQGFFVSRPLTVADLSFWMSERSAHSASA